MHYTFHTVETAPPSAKPILEGTKRKLGFVPNLYAGMANSPVTLEAYIALSGFFDKTSLSPTERQVVYLATSVENGCEFCVAAHSVIAKKMVGVPPAFVDALRDYGLPQDSKLAALAAFSIAVVRERGWVAASPALVDFLEAGYTREQALEVVLGVTQKILSNYANHLLGTPVNPELQSEAWTRNSA